MNKIIFGLLSLLLSLPACAEWVSYQRNAETEEFFDPTSIKREQSQIQLWTLTNYAAPITSLEGQELYSEKSLTTIDCGANKIGVEKMTKHAAKNGQGALVATMETKLRMIKVRADSADQILTDKLCH
jgi:hypothetical protein